MTDIKQVYRDYALQGRDDAQKLGWNDQATQDQYMGLMLDLVERHVPLVGKVVHDAGCGYGALWPRLKARNIGGYIGTDLMPESAQKAKEVHPEADFRALDLLHGVVPSADVTICMGALAYHRADDAMHLVERLWAASSVALAFNCWWDLTPAYVGYWDAQKLQKRLRTWLKGRQVVMLGGYERTERMFLALKPVVEKRP